MDGLPPLDDSLFEEVRKARGDDPSMPYNAKFCQNQWFLTASEPEDNDLRVTLHKYRADYHYLRREYSEALAEYGVLGDLQLSSAIRRDVMDGRCRCLLKVNKLVEANAIATEMVSMASNDDHLLHALRSLAAVQLAASDLDGLVDSCQRCVHVSPTCGSLWLDLARAYDRLESRGGGGGGGCWRRERLVCLLNARQLSKMQHLNMAPSFYQDKNESKLQSLDAEIDKFEIDEKLLERLNHASARMNFSTKNEDIDEMRTTADLTGLFNDRWFTKHKALLDAG